MEVQPPGEEAKSKSKTEAEAAGAPARPSSWRLKRVGAAAPALAQAEHEHSCGALEEVDPRVAELDEHLPPVTKQPEEPRPLPEEGEPREQE